MPLPIIPNTFRCTLNWTASNGQSAANVIHLLSATLTSAQVAAALDANVTANMWAVVSGAASVNLLEVTKLDGSSATAFLSVSGAKWTGAGGVLEWTPAATQVLSLRTTLRGRSRRGRIYLPFTTEANVTDGIITVSLAAQTTAWSNFLTAMNTANATLGVASYTLADAIAVTQVICEPILGTQRRRQSRLR